MKLGMPFPDRGVSRRDRARGSTFRRQIGQLLARLWGIPLPDPLDGVREELLLGVADAVAGPAAEQVLILVSPGLEHLRYAVVGLDPVVHPVPHDIRVK